MRSIALLAIAGVFVVCLAPSSRVAAADAAAVAPMHTAPPGVVGRYLLVPELYARSGCIDRRPCIPPRLFPTDNRRVVRLVAVEVTMPACPRAGTAKAAPPAGCR
jgi:hypothetical protein